MPLVNVIRGERIDPAPLNVRPPYLRIPIWLALTWWFLKGLAVSLVLPMSRLFDGIDLARQGCQP
jgi:hypothetical protein